MKLLKILLAVLFTGSIVLFVFSGCATKQQALVEEEPEVEKKVEPQPEKPEVMKEEVEEERAGESLDLEELSSQLNGMIVEEKRTRGMRQGKEKGEEILNLEIVEKNVIQKALEQSGWVQTHAARILGITERTLRYKMKKHNIRKPE